MSLRNPTQNQIDNIIQLYNSGINATCVGREFKSHTLTIQNILINNGIPLREKRLEISKYLIDEYFFNEIDSPEKAYFLGWMFADGNNEKTGHSFNLTIHKNDRVVLEKFKQELKSTHLIKKHEKKCIKIVYSF